MDISTTILLLVGTFAVNVFFLYQSKSALESIKKIKVDLFEHEADSEKIDDLRIFLYKRYFIIERWVRILSILLEINAILILLFIGSAIFPISNLLGFFMSTKIILYLSFLIACFSFFAKYITVFYTYLLLEKYQQLKRMTQITLYSGSDMEKKILENIRAR